MPGPTRRLLAPAFTRSAARARDARVKRRAGMVGADGVARGAAEALFGG
jgi:hypothetical protein